ncbi:endothelial cell-specific chemotaxis regulator isoform X2 [Phascolarctos cinereus]|uniref:Endothelial cell-specific chemotaxis regulator isoform X2 n=1 Tax=Phascolarctos cinereus TaxID=38626 RepID=A0A6P5LQR5_PHACI|nr:endothelial cell-specific chemotaxis regulator isoform X2 [Phascolarctos cinereus]
MSTIRAQLCLGIISYILFQGGSSQSPQGQSPGFQQGSKPSSFTAHSAPQSTTGIPESLRMSTLVSTVRGESSSPRPSILHSLQSSPSGPTMKTQTQTQTQKQEATSGRGTSALSYKRSQIPTSAVTSSEIISKSTIMDQRTTEEPIFPTPTSETVLTVAAFGVITFIVILVVVVIILVSVVSLRFKCQKNKESEDPQKPDSCGMSESSTANREKDTSITLISMKNINSNNNKGCFTEEKVL